MLRLARILGQDKTTPTPALTYEGVCNKPDDSISSEGALRNNLSFNPVPEHPNPVTKLQGKVAELPIHPHIYQGPAQPTSKKQHPLEKSETQEPI